MKASRLNVRSLRRDLSNTGTCSAALVDQPGKVLGREKNVASIGDKPLGPQAEPVGGALDHDPLRRHLGLPDGGGAPS